MAAWMWSCRRMRHLEVVGWLGGHVCLLESSRYQPDLSFCKCETTRHWRHWLWQAFAMIWVLVDRKSSCGAFCIRMGPASIQDIYELKKRCRNIFEKQIENNTKMMMMMMAGPTNLGVNGIGIWVFVIKSKRNECSCRVSETETKRLHDKKINGTG